MVVVVLGSLQGGVAVLFKDLGPLVADPFCLIVEDQLCTVSWFMYLSL